MKPTGRAALVMANSASDARNSEADIRKNLVKSGVIDGMLTLPKNMFYTVTLPATLWFFDKRNAGTEHKILFVDARNIFRQVTRALREFTEEHIQNIATIFRLFRGETERLTALLNKYKAQVESLNHDLHDAEIRVIALKEKIAAFEKEEQENSNASNQKNHKNQKNQSLRQLEEAEKQYKALHDKQLYFEAQIQWLNERFPNGVYEDVTGLCKAATFAEIEEQDWSMNPGRYVGVVIEEDGLTEEEFLAEMKKRHQSFIDLNSKAFNIEQVIEINFKEIL